MKIKDLENKIKTHGAHFFTLEKEGEHKTLSYALFPHADGRVCYIELKDYAWDKLHCMALNKYDKIKFYGLPTGNRLFAEEDEIEKLNIEPVELTIEEIAKKFNLKPSQIRIKE